MLCACIGSLLNLLHCVIATGFVIGFFVGKKFGGVHVHLTTPALPPGYTLPPAATQLAASPAVTSSAVSAATS
jgi:hypothetical protein